MANSAQIAANQANAKQSTGPRTEKGKASSARNATRHGLSGHTFVVADDERGIFEEFLQDHRDDLQPIGALQHDLFDQIVLSAWNLRRLSRLEAELISGDGLLDPLAVDANAKRLQLLMTYRGRNERSLHKALTELRRLQEEWYYRKITLPASEDGEPFPALPSFFRIRQFMFRDQMLTGKSREAAIMSFVNAAPPLRKAG
jgi:hypothetical protein